jgi:hypothetical protein
MCTLHEYFPVLQSCPTLTHNTWLPPPGQSPFSLLGRSYENFRQALRNVRTSAFDGTLISHHAVNTYEDVGSPSMRTATLHF